MAMPVMGSDGQSYKDNRKEGKNVSLYGSNEQFNDKEGDGEHGYVGKKVDSQIKNNANQHFSGKNVSEKTKAKAQDSGKFRKYFNNPNEKVDRAFSVYKLSTVSF